MFGFVAGGAPHPTRWGNGSDGDATWSGTTTQSGVFQFRTLTISDNALIKCGNSNVIKNGVVIFANKEIIIGNNVEFIVSVKALDQDFYLLNEGDYEVDLFKDFYVSPSLISTLKSNNKALNVVGSIYAKENKLDNCLLINTNKSVVEALNGNVFLVKGNTIKTPPLSDGCLKGIIRKQLIEIINLMEEYTLEEASISPFEIQKADEMFITNVITGIQPVSKYRKKQFATDVAKALLQKLNVKVRLS